MDGKLCVFRNVVYRIKPTLSQILYHIRYWCIVKMCSCSESLEKCKRQKYFEGNNNNGNNKKSTQNHDHINLAKTEKKIQCVDDTFTTYQKL